jgi:hypothetical protein
MTDAIRAISTVLISQRSLTRMGNAAAKRSNPVKMAAPTIKRGSTATPYQ